MATPTDSTPSPSPSPSNPTTPLSRICVFCGSSSGSKPEYRAAAVALAQRMVEERIGLVYGGGTVGLMGAIATTVSKGGLIGTISTTVREGPFLCGGSWGR